MKIFFLSLATIIQLIEVITTRNELYKTKWKNRTLFILKVTVLAALFYFTWDEIIYQKKQNSINAIRGDFGNQKDGLSATPVLLLGSSGMSRNGAGDFTFNEPSGEPLKIHTEDNQLQIKATIRDSKGDVIASIYDRTWEIENADGIDYNNDDSAFEIMTGGRIVYQIFLKKDTVVCNGLICSQGGYCWYAQTNSFTRLPKLQGTQRFILPMDFIIKPLFKYPRHKYLGIREVY